MLPQDRNMFEGRYFVSLYSTKLGLSLVLLSSHNCQLEFMG